MGCNANITRSPSRIATFGASPRVFCETSTTGSTPHDQANFHRDRAVSHPVRHLCGLPGGDARGRVAAVGVDDAAPGGACHRIAASGGGKFPGAGKILRRAAGLDLCAGAYRGRQVRAGRDAVTAGAQLGGAAWLKHGEVARLLALLDRDGEEARVVGGAVRNTLLHLPVGEIDVATTALPEEVMRRVEAAGWKAIPTGIEHGTVTVVIDGKPFEVTTLRRDIETYGRKAKVVFGRDWTADAQRRDFTINALSAAADGKIYDYVGGIADIAARRVRFIGDAEKRIAEDYLRILRFFRFHAWYGEGAPDAAGLHACIRARAGLEMLSRERVRMELLKLLHAPHATPMLAVMAETGILGAVLGGVPLLASFENVVKAEAAMGFSADAVRRLGALAVTVKEDGERLGQRLRLSNAEAERLVAPGR